MKATIYGNMALFFSMRLPFFLDFEVTLMKKKTKNTRGTVKKNTKVYNKAFVKQTETAREGTKGTATLVRSWCPKVCLFQR